MGHWRNATVTTAPQRPGQQNWAFTVDGGIHVGESFDFTLAIDYDVYIYIYTVYMYCAFLGLSPFPFIVANKGLGYDSL